jgi:hypothetical protein
VLLKQEQAGKVHRFLREIETTSQRAAALIRQLLVDDRERRSS